MDATPTHSESLRIHAFERLHFKSFFHLSIYSFPPLLRNWPETQREHGVLEKEILPRRALNVITRAEISIPRFITLKISHFSIKSIKINSKQVESLHLLCFPKTKQPSKQPSTNRECHPISFPTPLSTHTPPFLSSPPPSLFQNGTSVHVLSPAAKTASFKAASASLTGPSVVSAASRDAPRAVNVSACVLSTGKFLSVRAISLSSSII